MSRKTFRGSKGDLRKNLAYANEQVREMGMVLSVLLNRQGGKAKITMEELNSTNADLRFKVTEKDNIFEIRVENE